MEDRDGIELHLCEKCCTCHMYLCVTNSVLCNCSVGHTEATLSEFFRKSVKCEVWVIHMRD